MPQTVQAKYDLAKFYRRYRMGPKVFDQMLHDIQDAETGLKEFRTRLDALGEMGVSDRYQSCSYIMSYRGKQAKVLKR